MFMDPRSIPGTIEGMRSIISDGSMEWKFCRDVTCNVSTKWPDTGCTSQKTLGCDRKSWIYATDWADFLTRVRDIDGSESICHTEGKLGDVCLAERSYREIRPKLGFWLARHLLVSMPLKRGKL
jgi:hypothetical protein